MQDEHPAGDAKPSEAPSEASYHDAMTVGEFRELIADVPDTAPLVVGIRDRRHFGSILGDLPVQRATLEPGPRTQVVVMDVRHIS
jgi:hypothetical protein